MSQLQGWEIVDQIYSTWILLYRQMQISQRQLTLQRIIKNQEARILELEKLINSPNPTNGDRVMLQQKEIQMEEIIADYKDKNKEKQMEISLMKQQISNLKAQIRGDKQNLKKLQIFTQQRDHLLRQTTQLVSRNKQLESQLSFSQSSYQKQIQKLIRSNQTLGKQAAFLNQNVKSIELQIQKLQIFYRSSLHELPKRKQTLTWVGNLMKFIDKYEQLMKDHPLEKQCQYLQKPLNDLKDVMSQCSQEIKATFTDRIQQMKKLKDQIIGIITQNNKKYEQVLQQNKIFWDQIKKQKIHRTNQTQRKLDQQNRKIKEEYQMKNIQISKQLKALEQQKRQIVLAIQQLKGFYQTRQKNFKQEIALLKNTQLKLVQCSQRRQLIFQEQILRLSEQVSQLGTLYENAMKNNLKVHREHIEGEMQNTKQLLIPSSKNQLKQILYLLKEKQSHLQKQMSMLSQQQLKGLQLVKNSCDTLITFQNNMAQCLEVFKTQENQDQEQGGQFNIEVMRFQQLQQRKNYELNISKKKNQRLHDMVLKLQQKIKNQTQPRDNQLIRALRQKIRQLQDQNSILIQSNERYKKKFNSTLLKLSKVTYNGLKQRFQQGIKMTLGQIQRIQSTQYEKLLPLIKQQTIKQQEYAETIESTLKNILKIMESPFEYLTSMTRKRQQQIKLIDYSSGTRVIQVNVNFRDQIRQYKQILQQRVSSNSNNKINKIIADLIANIRATLPQRESNRSTLKQTVDNVNSDRKSIKVRTPMENRIRQLQNSRIVDKNQISKGLQRVQHFLKKLDMGKHTLNKSTQILGKIQLSLGKVTKQIGQMLQKPLIQRQFKELTGIAKSAISDLESKLKQSSFQNQGMLKQFKLLSKLQFFKQQTNERSERLHGQSKEQ